MTRRPHRATLAYVMLLSLLSLFGCGGDDERSRVPVDMPEESRDAVGAPREAVGEPREAVGKPGANDAAGKQEVKSFQAAAKCLQGVPGVSHVTMQIGGLGVGAKGAGLVAAVGTNVATVYFFDSTAKAKQSAKLFSRGAGVYRAVGRTVIQYPNEPETRLEKDFQRCLTDPAPR